jgi:hypothetical protein
MKNRVIVHGEVWFSDENAKIVNQLVKHQSSAVRSAYQAIHQHSLRGNDIVKYVKNNYMKYLNQRYINDSVMLAKTINQRNSIFGGKKNWKNLVNKSLYKKEWINIRNSQLYSRGDKAHDGNPNIRMVGKKLIVNDPSKWGKWVEGNLFISQGFKIDYTCYDVRLIRKTNNKFQVTASYEKEIELPFFNDINGVVGVDINPDGVALVETDRIMKEIDKVIEL